MTAIHIIMDDNAYKTHLSLPYVQPQIAHTQLVKFSPNSLKHLIIIYDFAHNFVRHILTASSCCSPDSFLPVRHSTNNTTSRPNRQTACNQVGCAREITLSQSRPLQANRVSSGFRCHNFSTFRSLVLELFKFSLIVKIIIFERFERTVNLSTIFKPSNPVHETNQKV